jgi:hypothetical protein
MLLLGVDWRLAIRTSASQVGVSWRSLHSFSASPYDQPVAKVQQKLRFADVQPLGPNARGGPERMMRPRPPLYAGESL